MKIIRAVLLTLLIAAPAWATSTILLVGDSHSEGSFGSELYRQLESRGNEVHAYGVGGSTPLFWLQGLRGDWGYWEQHPGQTEVRSSKEITPRLSELLRRHSPSIVIIEQGANYMWQQKPNIESELQDLLRLLGSRPCYWVGAPAIAKRLPGQSDWMSSVLNQRRSVIRDRLALTLKSSVCQWIDSASMTIYPEAKGDGVHYDSAKPEGPEIAKSWAQRVSGIIR